MRLFSPAFSEGETIPAKYTCDGENVSPPLEWEGVPQSARSLALIVDDPDAPSGVFVHWLLFQIPAGEQGLTEAVGLESSSIGGALQGRNGFGKIAYGGPCPPSGTHRYYFRLYALDSELSLQAGASRREIDASMRAHIVAEAQLMGRYQRSRS